MVIHILRSTHDMDYRWDYQKNSRIVWDYPTYVRSKMEGLYFRILYKILCLVYKKWFIYDVSVAFACSKNNNYGHITRGDFYSTKFMQREHVPFEMLGNMQ